MSQEYGQPNAGDATSKLEQQIESEAQRSVDFLEEQAAEVINRPIGSKAVTRSEQIADYLAIRNDVEALVERGQNLVEQYGDVGGLKMFVDWAKKNEEDWAKLSRR